MLHCCRNTTQCGWNVARGAWIVAKLWQNDHKTKCIVEVGGHVFVRCSKNF